MYKSDREYSAEMLIIVKGNAYSLQEYADEYHNGNIQLGIESFELLEKKGSARTIEVEKNKTEKSIEKAYKEKGVTALAEYIESEEDIALDKKAERKRDGRLVYESIEIPFNNIIEATQYETQFKKALRLKDTEVRSRNGNIELVLYNITDADYNYVSRVYSRDKAINNTVGFVDKGLTGVTDAVDYTAKNIIAPVTKVTTKGVASLFKTVASTVARTGATIVTSTKEGAIDTFESISTDKEVIKAGRDLIDAKDTICRTTNNKFGVGRTNSQIRINK